MSGQDWIFKAMTEMAEGFDPPSASLNPPPEITVHKFSGYLPISTELAVEYGLISEDEARARGWVPTPRPKIPWHRRLRWRLSSLREQVGRKVGGWIAGVDLSERDYDE